jgi:hypothetical protein
MLRLSRAARETLMSNSANSSVSIILGRIPDRSAQPSNEAADPEQMVLRMLLDAPLPLPALADRTRIKTEELLPLLERLRARREVEIFNDPDGGKGIRLTPLGYSRFSA